MKKIIALVMVIAMIAAMCITTSAEDAAAPTDGLLFHLTFDDADAGLKSGSVVAKPVNSEAEDAVEASINTEDAKVGGGAYDFKTMDDKEWLSLKNEDGSSVLTGANSLTVSFWVNSDCAATHWRFFAVPQNEDGTGPYQQVWDTQQTYFGVFTDNASKVNIELYNAAATIEAGLPDKRIYNNTSGIVIPNEWSLITVVLDGAEDAPACMVSYVDGEWMGEKSVPITHDGHSLSEILGENSYLYLGYATWSGGEYAAGLMDDLYVYDHALSDDELAALWAAQGLEVAPPKDETDAPAEPDTPSDETEAPSTNATTTPSTNAPTTNASTNATTDAAKEEGGCGSTLGTVAAVITVTSVFGCAVTKRKH